MKGSGYYSDYVQWMRRADGTQEANGSIPDSYVSRGWLWCRFENPKGSDKIMWGGLQSAVDVIIRFRGNPGVRSIDRMEDADGNVFVLNGITLDQDGDDQVAPAVRLVGAAP